METKMKYFLLDILFTIIIVFFLAGCSKVNDNIPVAPKLTVHTEGFTNPSSPNFHGTYIKDNNYQMQTCENCHAANFTGGTTGVACTTCHKDQNGPMACNTCHGDFNNPSRPSPPRDVNGNTSTTLMSVGAHANHLYNNTLGQQVACNTCHVVPQSVYSPGHLDASPNTIVTLSGNAKTNIASNAAFDPNTGNCSNTYCHGNFKYRKSNADPTNQFAFTDSVMVGTPVTVTWTKVDGSQAQCGSCHGLPPAGHIGPIPLTECFTCHGNVVDPSGKIINPALHVNGTADVRGTVVSGAIKPGTTLYNLIHQKSR